MPLRASPVAPPRVGAMPSTSPLRAGLEPLVRSLPARVRSKQDDDLSFLKPLVAAGADELQSPELLQQSVASGARFVIQHLPPLEGLPSLPARAQPAPMESDELPDLSAAALSLETAHDTTLKPPITFAGLIAMAILDSPAKRLTVGEIYEWIKTRYPYFSTAAAGVGWKNSVRHNLSLSRHFMKKARDDDSDIVGKGAHWCLRPESYLHCEAAIIKQAKVYQKMGGGLADIAGLSLDLSHGHGALSLDSDDRSRRTAVPRGRRPEMRELSSTDAAAALVSLTNAALPAVRSQAGARSRSVVVRTGGSASHSATMRYYPDSASRRQADAMGATMPASSRTPVIVRAENEDSSPPPGPDEGIGATPDMSPRKRSNSGTLYTFAAPMTQLDGSVRSVPDGRRSPPHARRRLSGSSFALRDSVHEEGQAVAAHSDALAATAALMSLAALAADSAALPSQPISPHAHSATLCAPASSSSPLAHHVAGVSLHSPVAVPAALSPVPEVHVALSPPAPEASFL